MASHWKSLNLSFSDLLLPPLLVKCDFGPSQYTIFLTDLTYIWSESLERKQIIKRALNVDTSIDPSESTDQLRLLLQNIQKPLNGNEGAKLSISKGENPKQLVFHTTTRLPASLRPLQWLFYLDLAPQDVLTTEFLLPFFSQQYVARAQIDSLVQLLKDKDHVINKLMDRMQSDGSDLSKVFPGAAASKGETKLGIQESARKSVKGLSEFDQERWRKDLSAVLGSSQSLPDIIPRIFVPDSMDTLEVNRSTGLGDWWYELKDDNTQQQDVPPINKLHQNKSKNANGSSDRDFGSNLQSLASTSRVDRSTVERENTPPTLSKRKFSQDQDSDHRSTTTDENDGDVQSPKPNHLLPQGTSAAAVTSMVDSRLSPKLSTNLRKDHESESDSFILQSPIDAMQASSETDTENDDNLEDPMSQKPKVIGRLQKPKVKLGRIGGKSNRDSKNKGGDRPDESGSTVAGDASLDAEHKMDSQLHTKIVGSPRLSRPLVQPASSVTIRETSQDRANNKREQLKRDFENKSNHTVKRKRKF